MCLLCVKVRWSGFYTAKTSDGITIVKGRETFLGSPEFKLVPPSTNLYRLLAPSFHQKYHSFGSSMYIRKQILDSGYYIPHIIARLKSIESGCPACWMRFKKRLFTIMGRISEDRLTFSYPFKKMQSDILGPFYISEHVNSRGKRKVWIMSSFCHISRYISLVPVESLNKTHILDAFRKHFLHYGEGKLI